MLLGGGLTGTRPPATAERLVARATGFQRGSGGTGRCPQRGLRSCGPARGRRTRGRESGSAARWQPQGTCIAAHRLLTGRRLGRWSRHRAAGGASVLLPGPVSRGRGCGRGPGRGRLRARAPAEPAARDEGVFLRSWRPSGGPQQRAARSGLLGPPAPPSQVGWERGPSEEAEVGAAGGVTGSRSSSRQMGQLKVTPAQRFCSAAIRAYRLALPRPGGTATVPDDAAPPPGTGGQGSGPARPWLGPPERKRPASTARPTAKGQPSSDPPGLLEAKAVRGEARGHGSHRPITFSKLWAFKLNRRYPLLIGPEYPVLNMEHLHWMPVIQAPKWRSSC